MICLRHGANIRFDSSEVLASRYTGIKGWCRSKQEFSLFCDLPEGWLTKAGGIFLSDLSYNDVLDRDVEVYGTAIGIVSLFFVFRRKDKMLSLGEGQKVQRPSFDIIALTLNRFWNLAILTAGWQGEDTVVVR